MSEFFFFKMCVLYVCVLKCAHRDVEVQGWFSPIMMVAGIDYEWSGLAAGAFTC